MPTYLVHGFRWQRPRIRIYIIMHDLDDAAPEWIIAPSSAVTLLNSFYTLYDFLPPSSPPPATYPLAAPSEKVVVQDDTGRRTLTKRNKGSIASLRRKVTNAAVAATATVTSNGNGNGYGNGNGHYHSSSQVEAPPVAEKKEKEPHFNDWSVVKLMEQYDPSDLSVASQPYAYVADYMVEISLAASLTEEMSKYEAKQRAEEGPLSTPSTPATPGTPGMGAVAAAGPGGELMSPPLSAREIRRKSRRLGWFEKLRDGLQKGADIGWYVVVCGDEERVVVGGGEERLSEETEEDDEFPTRARKSAGIKGFFGRGRNN